MREKVLTGSTIEMPFIFYNRNDGTTPIEVTNPTLKIYDSKRVQVGQTKNITDDRITVGTYLCYIVVPDHTPFIYVEVSALNDGVQDIKRERIETAFSYDDINTGLAPTLEEGVNSYLTYQEALELIPNTWGAEVWFQSTEDDRIRAIILATKHIDALPLKGTKVNSNQILQFPRILRNLSYKYDYDITNYATINNFVKEACLNEAIAILSREYENRESLINQGVRSLSLGDLKENYIKTGKKLYSTIAADLLKNYITKTIEIRL